MCLPHHGEVDDRKTGEKFYPVPVLTRWKIDHEGSNGPALAALGVVDEESLTELLTDVFTPPVKQLELIADQLERTGTLNADTVAQLRQIVEVMANTPARLDAATAALLADATAVYSSRDFDRAAKNLMDAAAFLAGRTLDDKITQLNNAVELLSASNRMTDAAPHRATNRAQRHPTASQMTESLTAGCGLSPAVRFTADPGEGSWPPHEPLNS